MKLSKEENTFKGDVLLFPVRKVQKRDINLSHIPTFPLEREGISVSTKEDRTRSILRERTLQDSQLPPFVIKMRKISAFSRQIENLRRTSKEISYYLQEIKNYSVKKS